MSDLSDFPITRRWPAQYPDRIQLYSLPTPNGVKASIMLEETGLPYEPHLIDFAKDDQKSPEFVSLNPNGKIPAMIDPDGPDGKPLALFESGAILLYLADKTGKFIPADPAGRWHAIQWVMFQMGGVGPMFGQLGFFNKFAGKDWFVGNEYTIADISMLGWVRNLIGFYEARDLVGFDQYANVAAWLERGLARPAVQKGVTIPARPA